MNESLLVVVYRISLGAYLAALLAGFGGTRRGVATAHALTAGAATLGAAASAAFLLGGGPSLLIGRSGLFMDGSLSIDRLSGFFLLLLNLVTVPLSMFASRYTVVEQSKYPIRLVVPLSALFLLGMQLVLLSSGPVLFLVGWEVMSLASFFLVLSDQSEVSRQAALVYLAITQFGAGALLAGMGLLSGGTIAKDFHELAANAEALGPGLSAVATGLVFFAFASKAGLAPFHAWLPEAHPRAPSHISALMSGVMLKVAFYGMLRFTFGILTGPGIAWGVLFLGFGLLGAAFAVVRANLARDIKRILAWSSVENMGLIFAAFGLFLLASGRGLESLATAVLGALYLHLLAHGLFKSGLFLGAGAILQACHTPRIDFLGGLARRMPVLTGAMLLLMIAGAGLPPSGLFVAEWAYLQVAIETMRENDPVAVAAGLGFLIGIALVLGLAVSAMVRLFAFVFLAEPRSEGARQAVDPGRMLSWPVLSLAILVLLMGILSPWLDAILPAAPGGPAVLVSNPSFEVLPLGLDTEPQLGPAIEVGYGHLFPPGIVVFFCLSAFLAWLIRKLLAPRPRFRESWTWDCGQPIDATMEYTGTAFSAPVRQYLRDFVQAQKSVEFLSLVPGNPWFRSGRMEFQKSKGSLRRLYYPTARLIEAIGAALKQLQNGVIQFYIALVLATLLVALVVAL